VNLRYVVPALGLAALSATSASAQEIAKGVTLDGYVDTVFTATSNDTGKDTKKADGTVQGVTASSTGFTSEGVLMVGWAPTDRISSKLVARSGDGFQTTGTKGSGALVITEAYGSVKATDQLTISTGKSTGPFGYYSQYATGVNFVTGVLSTKLYTVNPTGVWASFAPSDKVTATFMVADTYYNSNKTNRPSSVSPGVDLVFNATPELSLNLELTLDPNGGGLEKESIGDAKGARGSAYAGGFNLQFKKDAITAAGEVIYQVLENQGKVLGDDDQKNLSYAAFVTYALSGTPFPMAVTGQVSGWTLGDTGGDDTSTSATKAQLALLTNPLTVSQFGLNYELFYQMDDAGGKSDKINSYGVAIEGLYVIP